MTCLTRSRSTNVGSRQAAIDNVKQVAAFVRILIVQNWLDAYEREVIDNPVFNPVPNKDWEFHLNFNAVQLTAREGY